jgi:Lrp/AsnC family leucine-responsive transcriptional regulator
MSTTIDATDRQILQLMVDDVTTSRAEIGRKLKLAPSAVSARVKALTERGVLRPSSASINLDAVGLSIVAFVFVDESKPAAPGVTIDALSELGVATELHRLTGDDCFLLKIVCTDVEDLRDRLDLIGTVDSVAGVRTQLVLESRPGSTIQIPQLGESASS